MDTILIAMCGVGDALTSFFYLIDKWMIHEIGSANTKIQHINLFQYCVVESIQKPRGIRYLKQSTMTTYQWNKHITKWNKHITKQ